MKEAYSRRLFCRFLLLASGFFAGGMFGFLKDIRQPIKKLIASPIQKPSSPFLDTELQQILDRVVAIDSVPGVEMYLSMPQGVWSGVSGVRSMETGQKVQPEDGFSIASTSKTFVAVIALQLVEENKLSLDQSIADYLPKDIGDRLPHSSEIAVRQLLNHNSGVAEYLSTKGFINATGNRDRSRLSLSPRGYPIHPRS